jgi:citrate synthase
MTETRHGGADVRSGLEGVVAFATVIAEPDRDGGVLRYRGIDVGELVGRIPYERVWGLLVDNDLDAGIVAGEAAVLPARSGDVRVDLQAGLAMLGTRWNLKPLIDIDDLQARADLARLSAAVFSYTAQSARGGVSVDARLIERATSLAEWFLLMWRGEAPEPFVRALDAYWISAAEHGVNASTFTARVVASTGADCGAALSAAVGALSGPLHGGAPARVLAMLDEVEATGDADRWVRATLDRGERLMGFGHRVYRAEDPRARVLRRCAQELRAPRLEVASALEEAALAELHSRKPDRVLATNVEFWSAVLLDFAHIPSDMFTPLFACARTAGWSAHILEQKREARLIRPSAVYVGEQERGLSELSAMAAPR